MNKILLILFSSLISFNSYGEWTKLFNQGGITTYIDFSSIKTNRHVFFWEMRDYLKPIQFPGIPAEISSIQLFYELDCNVPRKRKRLSIDYLPNPMGQGSVALSEGAVEWRYPRPNSVGEEVNRRVCDYTNQ
jgi:hypothetical protein